MSSKTCQHQIVGGQIKRPSHQRNLTVVESVQYLNPDYTDLEKKNFKFKENKLVSQRFSCFLEKKDTNLKFQANFAFFKEKKSFYESFLRDQHPKQSKLKQKKQEGLKKVPQFIKERQLSKSQKTFQSSLKSHQNSIQGFSQIVRSQNLDKLKTAEKSREFNQKKENILGIYLCESFGFAELKKQAQASESWDGKGSQTQSSVKKGWEKEGQQFAQTQSTIKTVSHCLSEKNFFLSNLTTQEHKQIERDFQQLFSSRRVQTEMDFDVIDEELAKQFELILN